ncbi:MAG: radical SAM protein [Candidatus Buchananbacteria bacterium]
MLENNKKIFRGTPWHLSKSGQLDGFTYLMINFSFLCNYQCKKCFNLKNNKSNIQNVPITVDKIFALIQEAKAMNGQAVILAGEGEPSLYQDIKNIIEKIDASGMITIIYSNASILTEELINFYAAHNTSLVISFDSFSPELYLKLTGNNDESIFKQVLENIALARKIYQQYVKQENGHIIVRLAINTTVSSLNMDEVEKIKKFCGDDIFFICNPLAKLGNAVGNWRSLLRPDDYKTIESLVKQLSDTTGPLTLGGNGLCAYSSNGIGVSPAGDYMTCAYTAKTNGLLGNVFNKSLAESYAFKRQQEQNFYDTYGPCPCLVRSPYFDEYLKKLNRQVGC